MPISTKSKTISSGQTAPSFTFDCHLLAAIVRGRRAIFAGMYQPASARLLLVEQPRARKEEAMSMTRITTAAINGSKLACPALVLVAVR